METWDFNKSWFLVDVIAQCRLHVFWPVLNWWLQFVSTFSWGPGGSPRAHIARFKIFSVFFSSNCFICLSKTLTLAGEKKQNQKKTWCYERASHSLVPWWKKSFYVLTQMLVLIQFERGWPIQTRGKMLRCVRKIISNKIWIWSNILLECADFINLGMWQFQIFTTNQLGRRF